jgi:acyl-CoA synthetase (AMP-forming)/AMP-acid ligase II
MLSSWSFQIETYYGKISSNNWRCKNNNCVHYKYDSWIIKTYNSFNWWVWIILEFIFFYRFENVKILWITTDTIETSFASKWVRPIISKDSVCFLQYTSGSTGVPKGIY